jgi:hypothetical protein
VSAIEVVNDIKKYSDLNVDDIDWEFDQTLSDECNENVHSGIAGTIKYGFNRQFVNAFRGLHHEVRER